MKKKYLIYAFTAVFAGFMGFDAITNSSGSPQGRNGSPASNGNTCASSGCHGGPSQSSETVSISSNIPANGFMENSVYTFTISADDGGRSLNRMGFQASVEDGSGHQGTVIATDATETQKTGNYITHRSAGISVSGGQKSWTFDWNSGSAADQSRVYAVVNFANGNGSTSGDVIVTHDLVLQKDLSVGVSEQPLPVKMSLYPNPVIDEVTLASNRELSFPLQINNVAGQQVAVVVESEVLEAQAGHYRLSLSELKPGFYWLQSAEGATAYFQKK